MILVQSVAHFQRDRSEVLGFPRRRAASDAPKSLDKRRPPLSRREHQMLYRDTEVHREEPHVNRAVSGWRLAPPRSYISRSVGTTRLAAQKQEPFGAFQAVDAGLPSGTDGDRRYGHDQINSTAAPRGGARRAGGGRVAGRWPGAASRLDDHRRRIAVQPDHGRGRRVGVAGLEGVADSTARRARSSRGSSPAGL